jgi:hypothetical protein
VLLVARARVRTANPHRVDDLKGGVVSAESPEGAQYNSPGLDRSKGLGQPLDNDA